MKLSSEQRTLVAQLVKIQEQPDECFTLIHTNAKTRAFGRLFSENGLIALGDDSVELLPAFFVEAHRNGVTDESGDLTEEGEADSVTKIEETYKFFKVMLAAVSGR
jgi:hypothetical protein